MTLKTALQDLTEECDELRSENVRMKSTNQKLESEIELFSLEQRGKSTEIKNTKEILTKDCFQHAQSVFLVIVKLETSLGNKINLETLLLT